MIRNQKGFTLIELLIAVVIIITVITVTFQFYESYNYGKSEFGEYITAKNLAVGALEEQRDYFIEINDVNSTLVYNAIKRVNGTDFTIEVTKENENDVTAVMTDEVKFIKLTSLVKWKNNKVEVVTYVSER